MAIGRAAARLMLRLRRRNALLCRPDISVSARPRLVMLESDVAVCRAAVAAVPADIDLAPVAVVRVTAAVVIVLGVGVAARTD